MKALGQEAALSYLYFEFHVYSYTVVHASITKRAKFVASGNFLKKYINDIKGLE
jgi:hypothetical protein